MCRVRDRALLLLIQPVDAPTEMAKRQASYISWINICEILFSTFCIEMVVLILPDSELFNEESNNFK